jgi:hypothetical protein
MCGFAWLTANVRAGPSVPDGSVPSGLTPAQLKVEKKLETAATDFASYKAKLYPYIDNAVNATQNAMLRAWQQKAVCEYQAHSIKRFKDDDATFRTTRHGLVRRA